MAKIEKYKRNLTGAIVLTLIFAILVFEQINNKNETDLASFISVAVVPVYAMFLWILATKQYIDFAIEENDKDRKIMNIALQEKIKQLQKKE